MTLEEKAERWIRNKHHIQEEVISDCVRFVYQDEFNSYIAVAKELEQENNYLKAQIEKLKNALLDIKANTDDVNIEWQIKYLFDELDSKE